MDLWYLKPGHKIRMRDGAEAEVLSETEDGNWIKVRYLDGDDPLFAGTDDLAHRDEVQVLLGVVAKSAASQASLHKRVSRRTSSSTTASVRPQLRASPTRIGLGCTAPYALPESILADT